MSTTALFTKHFGDTPAVGIFHPNVEAFFEELNQECLEEDRQRQDADSNNQQIEE